MTKDQLKALAAKEAEAYAIAHCPSCNKSNSYDGCQCHRLEDAYIVGRLASVTPLYEVLRQADEYLSETKYEKGKPVQLNSIGAGSKIHQMIKSALSSLPSPVQNGMRWVKCSERLPHYMYEKDVHYKLDGDREDGYISYESGSPVFVYMTNGYIEDLSRVEWLDEGPSPEKTEEDEWISVNDKLPTFFQMFSERVLGFDGRDTMKVVSLFKNHDGRYLGYNTTQYEYMMNVVYWRPLPPPPKKNKKS